MMVVGVTGSLAALGDTLFPASSLGQALAQDFSAGSGWLVRWRWTHPTVAFQASIFLSGSCCAWRGGPLRNAHWDNRELSALVLLLLAAQYFSACWMCSCWRRYGCRWRICWVPMCCGWRCGAYGEADAGTERAGVRGEGLGVRG